MSSTSTAILVALHIIWFWLMLRTDETPGEGEFTGRLTRGEARIHRAGWVVWFAVGFSIPIYVGLSSQPDAPTQTIPAAMDGHGQ